MQGIEIAEGIYWVGVQNPALRIFDIIIPTEHGTSYNAYLVRGEKTALIDTVHSNFTDELIAKVSSLCPLEALDYLVVNHTEMDHSGSLPRILELAPKAEVLSSPVAAGFLREIMNREFPSRIVKDGETLDLGGKTLRFLSAPYWHWPDTIFTYVEEDRILFPCDGFGSHFSSEKLYDDQVGDFQEDFYLYFSHIMRPFRKKILEGLKKIEGLEIRMIAPSHGPILRSDPQKYIRSYREWCEEEGRAEGKTVVIFYTTAYGGTEKMAEAIAEGASRKGAVVRTFPAEGTAPEAARSEMEAADLILFGSPTFNGDAVKPIWDLIALLPFIERKKKHVAAFGTYGWSGEAVKLMEDRFRGLHMKIAAPGLRLKLVPGEEKLEECIRFGEGAVRALEEG
jgi:flavorubredoxin